MALAITALIFVGVIVGLAILFATIQPEKTERRSYDRWHH